jgi:nicotinamidase-related amidase
VAGTRSSREVGFTPNHHHQKPENHLSLTLDPKSTALVLIDLQNAIVSRQLAPHAASDVVARSAKLAEAVRASGGTVVYVHVLITDILSLPVDRANPRPADPIPPEASELVPAAGFRDGDVLIAKRQWGAFYGTNLEQQLRRRGIRAIIMAGIATNMGVESTARAAHDQGYELVFAEDAMSSMSVEFHQFSIQNIFPIMGRVRSSIEIIEALKSP